jgi:hypothetical protein
MAKSFASEDRIERTAILELFRTARIMKRQLKILKGMRLNEDERKLLKEALKSVEDDCNIFKI